LNLAIKWQWPILISTVLYLLTASAIIISRLGYERRRRLISQIENGIECQPTDDSAAFAGLSPADVKHLAFGHSASRTVNEAIARFLVRSFGSERLAGTAVHKKWPGSRWKRIAAFRVLAFAQPAGALPILEFTLDDPDPEVAAASATTLGSMKEIAAARMLVDGFERGQLPASRIATFLHRFAADIPELLRPLFHSPAVSARYWAAVLSRRYSRVSWISEELTALVEDPDPTVRKAALQSLGIIRAPAAKAVHSALKDPVWYVRAHAARALGRIGALQYASDIAELLADREWWVRQAAKEALINFGGDAEGVVLGCLSHSDRFARNSAAEILQNTGGFERLLTEEISGRPDGTGRRKVLALLCNAAGQRMTNAVVERLPETFQKLARGFIDSIGLREEIYLMANA
jgi:hypothetical protein